MSDNKILLSHGSGGKMMHDLVSNIISKYFSNPILNKMNDFALCQGGDQLVISTDTFVVDPYIFPGGDIGELAICGTVNDVAVGGAEVKYLTVGFVIEEGFPMEHLDQICSSIKKASEEAGVIIVSGDTKVVPKGAADGIFINTTGVGIKKEYGPLGGECVAPGDKVIISGTLGDHAVAILSKRENLSFSTEIESDCAPLNVMIDEIIKVSPHIKCMRDPTRGGVATTLNEIANQSKVEILLDEESLPVSDPVSGACEMLGMDPLYMANEGKILIVVDPKDEGIVLETLRKNKYGQNAQTIGEIKEGAPRVKLCTVIGSTRVVDMLTGEQIPRIC